MPLLLTAIDHVQIAIPPDREEITVAFYKTILGLREIEKPPPLKARGGAWFQIGPTQLHIGLDPHATAGAKAHICFLVDDLQRAREDCRAANIEIAEDPICADGLMRFFIRDPAGNRIEIGSRA